MLTRAQINRAINDKIKAEFTGIPIQSSDVEEGFLRPSFFVSLETRRTESEQHFLYRDLTCRIRFFSTSENQYKEEVYNVQDRLEQLFGLNFAAGSQVITIDDAETDVYDKVLHYDFEFSCVESIAVAEDGDIMEELVYND
ncbi:hypothetical protein BK126_04450 [Paenibacillus sp. FSL H7-0326]|uniref:phage tail terminator family protein n=1 Tax=Paenibacillus sp. FSL H7-0326 TaxID=1921144 RepID=UPI0009701859|nr:hypothetical protein BK126_04450 [Paenibacillus sp. FSL H7-0326]